MRTVALLLALLPALAGCAQEPAVGTVAPQTTGESLAPVLPPAPGEVVVSFTWSPEYPRVGEEVFFEAGASGLDDRTIDAWTWDFGDGTSGAGRSARHTYESTDQKTVRLGAEI